MTAYVLGKIVLTSATTLFGLVLTVVLGLIAFPGLSVTATGWLTLIWVSALGLLATIPLGITVGSLAPDPAGQRAVRVAVWRAHGDLRYLLPHLPGWLQGIGPVFPMYWLGLGLRAALLPIAGGGRDRRVLAAGLRAARAGRVGGRRAARGAADAAPDGAARVGLEGGGPARAGDAAAT